MAWNPNIPTVTNRVQDDLNAIRANFQHLDPLAPYVQALLDSRIVEMGSNANGEYMRWENGLQVCWHSINRDGVNIASTAGNWVRSPGQVWTFPAAFVSTPRGYVVYRERTGAPLDVFAIHATESTETALRYVYVSNTSKSGVNLGVDVLAIGRWK